jgi:hypothetical protein
VLTNSVTYNAAGSVSQRIASQFTETRTCNANLQLTSIAATPVGGGQGISLSYTYPAANTAASRR